jgi:hypothetical protein
MSELDAFRINMEQFAESTGGAIRVYLVRNDDTSIALACRLKQAWALILADAVSRALSDMHRRIEIGSPAQCARCDKPFNGHNGAPHAFLIWLPGYDEAKLSERNPFGVAQPICQECAKQDDETLMEHSVVLIRKVFHTVDIVEENYK